MQLYDREEHEVPIVADRVVLEEYGTYFCASPAENGAGVELLFGERVLERGADGRYIVPVGPWAGALQLQLHRAGTIERSLQVDVQPHASKLDPEAWARLLEDLDAWMAGITVGLHGGKHGHLETGVRPIPGLAVGLIELAPALHVALRSLIRSPRQSSRSVWRDLPMHAVRRIDLGVIRQVATDPRVRNAFEGTSSTAEPTVWAQESEPTIDHPANRYAAWLVRRVLSRLREVVAWLEAAPTGTDPDLAAWCVSRARAANRVAASIERSFRSSSLAGLRPEPPSTAALVVVQNDPLYSRFVRLCRPFLSPGFRPPAADRAQTVPVRPTFDLYELWTFLGLQRLLERDLPGARWKLNGAERLFAGTGAGAEYVAEFEGGRLRILFNLTFPGYLARGKARRFSLSRERRPDLVIAWEATTGQSRWICSDAKYRVRPDAVADAFASAHIYRDSLLMLDHGGRCAAAWLLVPAMHESASSWFEGAFLDEHGMGVFELRPGAEMPTALADRITGTLGLMPSARGLHVAGTDLEQPELVRNSGLAAGGR